MLGLFGSIKSIVTVKSTSIDNIIFLLHYKVTVVVLLICTMMISCKQHFGDPIVCVTDRTDTKFGKAIDAYCWVHATYTVKELIDGGEGGSRTLRPGVGPSNKNTTQKMHNYYQWVGFFLLFQAWLFYFPRFLWKVWEGGKVSRLAFNLKNELSFKDKDVVSRRKAVAKYIFRNFHRQNYYALRYIFCELMNVTNVLGQIVLTDVFLGYEFSTYGIDVLNFSDGGGSVTSKAHPMDKVFPKLSKCTFNQYGPSGNIVPYDVLCVLPLNILNEKVFILLWFWFLILCLLSLIGLLYRVITVFSASLRRVRLESRSNLCDILDLKVISRHSQFGDWFILYQLSKNMDPLIFADLIKDVALKLKKHNGFNNYPSPIPRNNSVVSKSRSASTLQHSSRQDEEEDHGVRHVIHSEYMNTGGCPHRHRNHCDPIYDSVPVEEEVA